MCELDSSGSGNVRVVGSCEYGNEPTDCIESRDFILIT
jgi:hypothetical protein